MRRLIALMVSAALLALLYAFVDLGALGAAIASADPGWLAAGLSLVFPLTMATALRFSLLVRDAHIGFGEANRLVLAASTLNLFLPSKMGDLAKSYAISTRHGIPASLALSVVGFEKALDMAALLVWGGLAIAYLGLSAPQMLLLGVPLAALLALLVVMLAPVALFPRLVGRVASTLPARLAGKVEAFASGWSSVAQWFWSRPARALTVLGLSLALWAAHLLQFWLFTHALGGIVPLADNMAFATLSIVVGLLPFTLAGIGSRDAAIVFFYGAYLSPADGAVLGILATLRYVMPAIAGLPFAGDFAGLSAARAPRPQQRPRLE